MQISIESGSAARVLSPDADDTPCRISAPLFRAMPQISSVCRTIGLLPDVGRGIRSLRGGGEGDPSAYLEAVLPYRFRFAAREILD